MTMRKVNGLLAERTAVVYLHNTTEGLRILPPFSKFCDSTKLTLRCGRVLPQRPSYRFLIPSPASCKALPPAPLKVHSTEPRPEIDNRTTKRLSFILAVGREPDSYASASTTPLVNLTRFNGVRGVVLEKGAKASPAILIMTDPVSGKEHGSAMLLHVGHFSGSEGGRLDFLLPLSSASCVPTHSLTVWGLSRGGISARTCTVPRSAAPRNQAQQIPDGQ